MNIFINGNTYSLTATNSNTVASALELFLTEQQTQLSFAVALNGQFVSKQNYGETSIKPNDALDILFPIVGG
ncbi:MAG: sulfur carrier protein ThiS [Thalassotalea sp.]